MSVIKYLGGDSLFLLRRYLNAETVFASFISTESSFHARMGEGKKDLKKKKKKKKKTTKVGIDTHRM